MNKKRRGIHALYARNPISADELVWGRKTDPVSRRGFLNRAGLAALSTALGNTIPFARFMPAGLIPAAFAQSDDAFEITGKEGLIVLNDRPLNAETPAHLLDHEVTPAKHFFVRNNGIPPQPVDIDTKNWRLTFGGESVDAEVSFTLPELKQRFKHYTYQLQIECGGNGRNEFVPAAAGNQWSNGAVACPRWTGARLADVLDAVGIKENAVYVAYYGADRHASGDLNKSPISRGVPLAKALEDESLIAWSMNDQDMPLLNGHPLRLVCGGWPGSVSGKWLNRIVVRDRVHDGAKMTGNAYRVPCVPVAPGSDVAAEQMCIIESMPVKSLITFPRSGIEHALSEQLELRGHAWAGDLAVRSVEISINFGATWRQVQLDAPANRLAWQHWRTAIAFSQPGYYEVWARAIDTQGRAQPMVLPGWNPKGYLNNACHRIAVQVA